MYNIAVIGKSSEVLGFMALGFDVKPAAEGREALSILKDLSASKKIRRDLYRGKLRRRAFVRT